MKNSHNNEIRDLDILEFIEDAPETTQATLAERLGVAVGTINWHIKRLIEKGYIKVRRIERRKLRYIITPQGISHRAKLLVDYINSSLDLYRLIRKRSLDAIRQIKKNGSRSVTIIGDGDVGEICRLTCIEQGIQVNNESLYPIFEIIGLKIFVKTEDQ